MVGEPTPFDRKHKSPKQKGAAVKYEVAMLKNMLAKGEMIETDAGYGYHGAGTCGFVRSRDDFFSKAEKREKSELRARHETVNHRFKTWGILKQQFRNDRKKHQFVFYAIAVLTQLQIQNGNVLFCLEPKSLKKKGQYRI
ncbi:MAG: hypothetical protein SGARI_006112 [Bacillariaceae sp.]